MYNFSVFRPQSPYVHTVFVYNNFKIISKPNSGYGATINLGIANANGEYIALVESDDFIFEDMFKTLYKTAKKFKADIVPVGICGFDGYAKKLFEKHITVKVGKPISYTLDEDEIVEEWARQICEFTGFENRVEQKETANV